MRANNAKFEGFECPATPDVAAELLEQYLNVVLINEQASVARLVGYVLARTLTGEAEVETSYSDLQHVLNLSRSAVGEGLQRALTVGYIRQVRQGENGHIKSVYALAWAEGESEPPTPPQNRYRNQAGSLAVPAYLPANETSLSPTLEDESEEALPFGADALENLNLSAPFGDISSYQSYQPTGSLSLEDSNIESLELESLESHTRPVAKTARSNTLPTYLANLGRDLSHELGDIDHLKSNHTQIAKLFQSSGLDEKEFARLMYQSRDLTHHYATLRPGEQLPPPGQRRNKMAYFFTVLRDKLGQLVQEMRQGVSTTSVAPKPTPPPAHPKHKNHVPSLKTPPQHIPKGWQAMIVQG
jgi:hypothetical protein